MIPLTERAAQQIVANIHRHHGPLPGGYAQACMGSVVRQRLCGAVILGRPTNRNNDDGQTLEVLRLATDGTRNSASALLGAAGRVARAMGAARIITYTLDSESGASLRGAGWAREADGIESWWTNPAPGRPVIPRDHYTETKVRWALTIRDPIPLLDDVLARPPSNDRQGTLL